MGDTGSISGWARYSGKGDGNPLPVFLPEKPHGQRSLASYSPWGHNVRHNSATEQQKSFRDFYTILPCSHMVQTLIPTPLNLSDLLYFQGLHLPPLGHLLSLSLAPTSGSQLQPALCLKGFYCGPVLSFHIS